MRRRLQQLLLPLLLLAAAACAQPPEQATAPVPGGGGGGAGGMLPPGCTQGVACAAREICLDTEDGQGVCVPTIGGGGGEGGVGGAGAGGAGGGLFTHPSGELVELLPAPGQTYGLARTEEGRLFASAPFSNQLYLGDDDGFSATAIPVGILPTDVLHLPATGELFVVHPGDSRGSVIVIDEATLLPTALPIDEQTRSVARTGDSSRVFVGADSGWAIQLQGAGWVDRQAIPLSDPGAPVTTGPVNSLVLDELRGFLYGSQEFGTVGRASLGTGAFDRSYVVAGEPKQLVLATGGRRLFVANEELGLQILDVDTGAVAQSGITDLIWALALTPDGTQLWASSSLGNAILVIDVATLTEVRRFAADRPRRIVFDATGATAFVALEGATGVLRIR